jgi:undecaprenyl-diphosphatase
VPIWRQRVPGQRAIAAYLSVRFLVRWFQTRTLTPFAIYCLAFGAMSAIRFL